MHRRWPAIKRHAKYGLLALAALLLQTLVLQSLPILGVTLVALPVIAAAIAMREEPVSAGLWGYAIGWLHDAVMPYSAAYHAIVLMLICAGIAWACRSVLRPSVPLAVLLTAGTLAVTMFFYFILFFFITGRAPFGALPQMVLLTSALSAPLAAVFYPATR